MKRTRLIRQLACRPFAPLVVAVSLCASASGFAQAGNGNGQRGNPGAQIFDQTCAGCHGDDARGTDRGPAIATMQSVISLSDADLFKVVHDGTTAGMPPFSQIGDPGITAVVEYLRTLQGVGPGGTARTTPPPAAVNGNQANGRDLFFGKAQCSNCHMVAGEGGVLGPDMTGFAMTHQPSAIPQSIVNPGSATAAQGRRGGGGGGFGESGPLAKDVVIVTKLGQKLTGVVRSEDNLKIAMITQDGRYHFLDRDAVAGETMLKTLMPTDYNVRLTTTGGQ